MVKCNSCSGANPEGSAFCNKCGKSLSAPVSIPPLPQVNTQNESIILPPFLQGVIILRPKELINRIWEGSRHTYMVMDGAEQSVIESGFVLATNQRAFFIKESGIFKKSYSAVDVVAYENINGITVKPGFLNDVLILGHEHEGFFDTFVVSRMADLDPATFKQGHSVTMANIDPSTYKQGRSVKLQDVQQILKHLAQERVNELETEKQKERIHYVLDFSFLRSEMEKGGVIVQTIKCPSCSAGITFPSVGTNTKCPYCGSMVYAQDMFEKMKGLISHI